MDIKAVGLDIGKSQFHSVGCNRAGRPDAQHMFNRGQLMRFVAKLPPWLIGMRVCPGSQHLARSFQRYGHDVRFIAPRTIMPYVKSRKNDFNDAEAIANDAEVIAEAAKRPAMHFVTVKAHVRLDLQALHSIRERVVWQRMSIIKRKPAFLIDCGLPFLSRKGVLRCAGTCLHP